MSGPRAPDFDALLRQGAQGMAVLRKSFSLVPSPLITTDGPIQIVIPESAFDYLLPIAMLLKPTGIAPGELLTISADTDFALGANSFTGLNDIDMTAIAANQPYLRGVPQPGLLSNRQWEEFDRGFATDYEPVIRVDYKVQSSIALSAATIAVVFYLYEITAI